MYALELVPDLDSIYCNFLITIQIGTIKLMHIEKFLQLTEEYFFPFLHNIEKLQYKYLHSTLTFLLQKLISEMFPLFYNFYIVIKGRKKSIYSHSVESDYVHHNSISHKNTIEMNNIFKNQTSNIYKYSIIGFRTTS